MPAVSHRRSGFAGCAPHLEYVGVATVLNLLIVGTASYRGVEYMDSVNFCGKTCHTVMDPEYTAYQNSPTRGWLASSVTLDREPGGL